MRTVSKLAHHMPVSDGFRYSTGLCGMVLALVSIAIGFEASVAAARSSVDSSVEIVNRKHKGDRLPLVQPRIIVPRAPAFVSKLPDGCDPLVSPLTRSELAAMAGRCVS